jgi:hypothetical protein
MDTLKADNIVLREAYDRAEAFLAALTRMSRGYLVTMKRIVAARAADTQTPRLPKFRCFKIPEFESFEVPKPE